MSKDESGSYEDSISELECIVADLESGDISLEDALNRYENAVRLIRECTEFLNDAEKRIEKLIAFDENGTPQFEPFDEAESTDSEGDRLF